MRGHYEYKKRFLFNNLAKIVMIVVDLTANNQQLFRTMNDNARAGYDTAIKLTEKMSRTIWSVYGGLLATNGFLISLAAFLASNVTFKVIPIKVLGVLGFLLCTTWFLITMRNFDFYRYYFAWARKFETDAFGDTVKIIRGGATFAQGETSSIGSSIERMRWGSRLFKVEWLIYVVIGIFTIIYGYLIFGFIN